MADGKEYHNQDYKFTKLKYNNFFKRIFKFLVEHNMVILRTLYQSISAK